MSGIKYKVHYHIWGPDGFNSLGFAVHYMCSIILAFSHLLRMVSYIFMDQLLSHRCLGLLKAVL